MNGCSKRPSSTVFQIWNVGHVVNKNQSSLSWFLIPAGVWDFIAGLSRYFSVRVCQSDMIDMGVL